jgi:two-component system response regulator HydG
MNKDAIILIVDDERNHADVLVEALETRCAKAIAAYSAEDAVKIIESERIDLVITDLNLKSDLNGIDILQKARAHDCNTQVILITAYATIDTCKEAIRLGAYDYLAKPIDIDQLREMVDKALPEPPSEYLPAKESDFAYEGVISRSNAMQSVFHVVRRVAPTNISVLIEGPSGTGKELMARAIHENSLRKNKSFRPVNCAGLTETLLESELFGHVKGSFTGAAIDRKGLFEVADKGTLFLDEIGDMPLAMQAKLLRVLEDGIVVPVGSNKSFVVDVRVISATNHDLAKLIEEKKFRQDLYFRIKGVSVTIPPLSARPEDIPELFGFFLKQACAEVGRDISRITKPAMTAIIGYDWPGNVRQLRHAIRTMVVMCDRDTIDLRDIPPEIYPIKRLGSGVAPGTDFQTSQDQQVPMPGQSLNEVEKQHIINTIEMTNGNRSEAAKILKIGERTLYRKIKEYGI